MCFIFLSSFLLWVICGLLVIIHTTVPDLTLKKSNKRAQTSDRKERNEAETNCENSWTDAVWRPWNVGLREEPQQPWETLSQHIKDPSAHLLSSSSSFIPPRLSPDSPPFMRLLRLFSFSSTRLLSASSFTLLFGHVFFASPFLSDPT